MKSTAALIFAALLEASALVAQVSSVNGNLTLSDFILSGTDERGQPWHLSGSHTRSNGYYITIDDFKLNFILKNKDANNDIVQPDHDGHIYVRLQSDRCTMNSVSKEIKSDTPVNVTIGKNVRITGIGYDVDLPQKVILLRSAVHVNMPVSKKTLNKQLKAKDTKK